MIRYYDFDTLARGSRAGSFMRPRRVAPTKPRGSAHHIQLLFCQQVKQLCFLLFSTTYELQISQVLCFDIHTKCQGVYPPPRCRVATFRQPVFPLGEMPPLFSSSCALFHFAYPVSPLIATLIKTWGWGYSHFGTPLEHESALSAVSRRIRARGWITVHGPSAIGGTEPLISWKLRTYH